MTDNNKQGMGIGPFGSAAIGVGMGILDNVSTLVMGKALQKQQLEGQKKALAQQNEAQMDIWNRTNFGAQMEHLKKAGLNPGLLYGMGGAGGGTTGGASAMPTSQGARGMDIAGAAQLALLNAQKENIEADTLLKKTNATKTAGVDTELGMTQIGKLKQETKNAEVQELILKTENEMKALDLQIKDRTLEDSVMMVRQQLEKLGEEAQLLLDNGKIRTAYWGEYIEATRADWAGKLLQNEATKAGISLTAQQITKIQGELVKMQADIMNDRYNTSTNRMRFNLEQKIRDISDSTKLGFDVVSNILKGVIILK